VLDWANSNANPVVVVQRPGRRVRWTHMVGDVVVWDGWSPYETFTVTPFFPYFRRGQTRGMIADLLGPQDEVNKRRSARLNIINRSANGGWIYDEATLDPLQQENLERYGSTAGTNIRYNSRNGVLSPPKPIEPATTPVAQAQLEQEADNDLNEISGVNKAAMGDVDTVQSGAALLTKQRGTIVGIEGYMTNHKRAKILLGRRRLELIQRHYPEERVVRIRGEGKDIRQLVVNQRTAAGIANNITIGKYEVSVDESPLSASFLAAQFEELFRMKSELGIPIPDEWIVQASSIGRKDELVDQIVQNRKHQRVQQLIEAGVAPREAFEIVFGKGGPVPVSTASAVPATGGGQ
jgi:hypothetical protein